MFSGGIRNPVLQLRIALAITLVSWALILWGLLEMRAAGWADERSSGTKIGLGMLPGIIGPFMVLNFWSAVRIVAALRRGENVLARWHVPAATLAEFVPEDIKRNGLGSEYVNDWKPPRTLPPGGVDIIFGADGVVVHNSYFALVTSGPYLFQKVGLLPHSPRSIEFLTVTTHSGGNSTTRRFPAVLRLPLPEAPTTTDHPDALKVVDHFRRVRTGEVVTNPNFYPRRVRIGAIGAAIFLPIALIGFFLERQGDPDRGQVPGLMLGIGLLFGGASLILALLATYIGRGQRQRG